MPFIALLITIVLSAPASAEEMRSHAVLHAFQRLHPCPANGMKTGPCPGWVKDHIVPLACLGPDAVMNLQWQTIKDGEAKDRWERNPCSQWYPKTR